jgi:peptidoglycan/LPS O-acetylase OafA/YrhL
MGVLRLLLALAVVAAHAGPALSLDFAWMTGGPLAVQCFYVISGFYMTLILNEKYVGPGSYGRFAKSRLLRLLPMYFVVVLLTLVVGFALRAIAGFEFEPLARWREHGAALPWGETIALGLVNLTIVGQDLMMFAAIDPVSHQLYFTPDFHREPLPAWQFMLVPPAWTIGVELMFYALAPLLVRARLVWVLAMIAASLGLRVFLMRHYGVAHDPWTYRFFPLELALFLSGTVAWHLYGWLERRRRLAPSICWAAVALLLAAVVGYRLLPASLHRAPFGLPLLLAVVPLLLPFVFHATKDLAFDRALGELCYPCYLLHSLWVFIAVGFGGLVWTTYRGTTVLVLTLVSAVVLWRCVGRPFERIRQRPVAVAPVPQPAVQ